MAERIISKERITDEKGKVTTVEKLKNYESMGEKLSLLSLLAFIAGIVWYVVFNSV